MHGIEQQFLALQKGFNELIPQSLLKAFDERELELVIGGLGTIDLQDWKTHTRLKHCTTETQQVTPCTRASFPAKFHCWNDQLFRFLVSCFD